MTRVSVAHRPEITQGADIIIHLAAAARPFRVGMTSLEREAGPAQDVGVTGFAAEGAKSAETGHDDCPGDATGDCSKRGSDWKDAIQRTAASRGKTATPSRPTTVAKTTTRVKRWPGSTSTTLIRLAQSGSFA